jgi:esterase/lipase
MAKNHLALIIDHLDDIVAAILAVGGFIALCLGHDMEIKSVMVLATGWLFKSGYEGVKNRRHK